MVKANATGKFCMYTLCASRPCHRGTCVAQSPSKFTCECPEGYRGRHCEVTLAVYHDEVGLSFRSLFAICICFMALLGNDVHHVHSLYCAKLFFASLFLTHPQSWSTLIRIPAHLCLYAVIYSANHVAAAQSIKWSRSRASINDSIKHQNKLASVISKFSFTHNTFTE